MGRPQSAGQWELQYADDFLVWLRTSAAAFQMLDAVCRAVEATVTGYVRSDEHRAMGILAEFPTVLAQCDAIRFELFDQALAYLTLHLPLRYLRFHRVLGLLLELGILPIGRSSTFAVLDVGAGPGPSITAARHFYAQLACFADARRLALRPSVLGVPRVSESSREMVRAMHYFYEHLLVAEQGGQPYDRPETGGAASALPCLAQLKESPGVFQSHNWDFQTLDVREEHTRVRRAEQRVLRDDEEGESTWWDFVEVPPSSFALVSASNMLTTKEGLATFAPAVRRLMTSSLVPGGVLVVQGGAGQKYRPIYEQLDAWAKEKHLHIVRDFQERINIGDMHDCVDRALLTTRRIASDLVSLTSKRDMELVERVKGQVRPWVFDAGRHYSPPAFRIRVYKRGRPPAKRPALIG